MNCGNGADAHGVLNWIVQDVLPVVAIEPSKSLSIVEVMKYTVSLVLVVTAAVDSVTVVPLTETTVVPAAKSPVVSTTACPAAIPVPLVTVMVVEDAVTFAVVFAEFLPG